MNIPHATMSQDVLPNYELLTRVSEGRARTYHALARTGAVVMAHFVDDSPAGEAQRARALVERLVPAERRKVVEIADVPGGVAFVTKFILDFDTFHAWLEAFGDGQPAMVPNGPMETAPIAGPVFEPPPPPAPSAREEGPGDFTRAFRAPLGDEAGDLYATPRDADPAPGPPIPPAPADEPGEFTRAFRAIGGVDASHPAPPPVTAPTASDAGAGWASPPLAPPAPPSAPPAAPPPVAPMAGLPEPALPGASASASTPPGATPPSVEPGDFTRAFRAVDPVVPVSKDPPVPAAPDVVVPPAAPAGPSEFTRIFNSIGDPGTDIGSGPGGHELRPAEPPLPPASDRAASAGGTPPAPAGVGPVGQGDGGPGEFTRLFGAITPDMAPVDPAPPVAPPAAPPRAEVPPPLAGGGSSLPTPNFGEPTPPPPAAPRVPEVKWRDGPAVPEAPPVRPPEPPLGAPPAGPGEFTRIFGRAEVPTVPDTPPAPPASGGLDYRAAPHPGAGAPPRAASDDGYLSRLAGQPPINTGPPPAPPMREEIAPQPGSPAMPPWLGGGAGAGSGAPPPPAGPSEFTRVIAAQSPVPAVAPPATPAPAPVSALQPAQPAPKGGGTALLIGIAVTVVLILVVILVFVLRSPAPSGDAVPEGEAPAVSEAVTPGSIQG